MCTECGCGLDTGLTCPECGGRMVLINNQATCLECGATPPADAHTAVHDEGHHHHHTRHAHEGKAELDDLIKLRVLLPHWIEHNEEHADSFRQWVARAREMGQDEAARRIEEAVARMVACNQALEAALNSLGEMH
jgi:hypothetical protein